MSKLEGRKGLDCDLKYQVKEFIFYLIWNEELMIIS